MTTPVFVQVEHPRMAPDQAQVAFTDGYSWSVIGLGLRQYGLMAFSPMPEVACPVVDISAIAGQDDDIRMVVNRHIDRMGVRDLPALIADMVALGASVRS